METNSLAAAAAEWSAPQSSSTDIHQQRLYSSNKIGIYGWRKRCLYLFISVLLVMVIINMALTLWIVKVMDFSADGMGKLRISKRGIRLEGESEFLYGIYATDISASEDCSLNIDSARNLTLNARNQNGEITTRMQLGDQKLEVHASKFTVSNSKGKALFSASDNEVKVDAETLAVSGVGGAVFHGSVQTPLIRSTYKSDLRIESPTRSLAFEGPAGIRMEARAGDIQASSLKDLKLDSTDGAVKFDGHRFYIYKLPEMKASPNSNDLIPAYQLCVCDNGKLFLAPASEYCESTSRICS